MGTNSHLTANSVTAGYIMDASKFHTTVQICCQELPKAEVTSAIHADIGVSLGLAHWGASGRGNSCSQTVSWQSPSQQDPQPASHAVWERW